MNKVMMMRMMEGGDDRRRERGYEPMESRFRDRDGREHYDNGRFAPVRSAYESPRMGDYIPPYMSNDEEEYRRKWTITEARNRPMMAMDDGRGYRPDYTPSAQYRDERNEDGMRRIYGFGVMDGGRAQYRGPDHGDEMEHRHSEMMRGHGEAGMVPPLTRERAEEWMRSLKNEDGTTGPHWSLEQVQQLMQQRGVNNVDPVRVWVAMNADYSDRVAVNRKYGLDKPDYYLDSAIAAWIHDKDAVENKEAAYYAYVVR